jgi:hypothetical protein
MIILFIHDGLNRRGYPYDNFGDAIDQARKMSRTAWMWWSIVRVSDNVVLASG